MHHGLSDLLASDSFDVEHGVEFAQHRFEVELETVARRGLGLDFDVTCKQRARDAEVVGKPRFGLIADVGRPEADAVHVVVTELLDGHARLEKRGAHTVIVVALVELRSLLEALFGLLQQVVDEIAALADLERAEKEQAEAHRAGALFDRIAAHSLGFP